MSFELAEEVRFFEGEWRITSVEKSPTDGTEVGDTFEFVVDGGQLRCKTGGLANASKLQWETVRFNHETGYRRDGNHRQPRLFGVIFIDEKAVIVEISRVPGPLKSQIRCSYHVYEHDKNKAMLTDAGEWHGGGNN